MGAVQDCCLNQDYMRKRKYTKEVLENACKTAECFSDVLRNLGLRTNGSDWQRLKSLFHEYQIQTSWTSGFGWSKGKTKQTCNQVAKQAKQIKYTNEIVFSENAPASMRGTKLANRLREIGLKYECAICFLTTWQGKNITFHVDHINGKNNDNRLQNLRFLCPNCHQQTDTWGNKKRHSAA